MTHFRGVRKGQAYSSWMETVEKLTENVGFPSPARVTHHHLASPSTGLAGLTPAGSEPRQHGPTKSQSRGQTVPGLRPLLRHKGGQEPIHCQRGPQSSAETRGAPPTLPGLGRLTSPPAQGQRQPGFHANGALLPALRPGWAGEGSILLHPTAPRDGASPGGLHTALHRQGPVPSTLLAGAPSVRTFPPALCVTRPPRPQLWRVCGLCPPCCGLT